MKIIKTLFLLLMGFQSLIFTQQMNPGKLPKIGVIYGTVIDSSTGMPIQYTSVSVINTQTQEVITGGITNEKGQFHIENIQLGIYNIGVEFIGYKKVVIGPIKLSPRGEGTEQNLGKIELSITSLQMDLVEVQGKRPIYVQTAEKKIFNVEQNTMSSGGSALDALRQVPGVDVDIDGKVSLRGSSNVNILIDGKPSIVTSSDQEMMLEAIPSDNIRDIEVITNPSAKYDPEGMAGIINIVLKENKFSGLNGNIKTGTSTNNAYNNSGQINYRNGKVNLFFNSALRNDVRGATGDNFREMTLYDVTSILDQDIEGERGGENLLFKGGIEFYPNQKNTIGLTASYSNGDRISNRSALTLETEDATIDSILEYKRIIENDNGHISKDITLTYNRKFENPKQIFSTYVNVSNGTDSRLESSITSADDYILSVIGGTDPEKTTTDNERTIADFQMDYVHPFSNVFKIETGYKGSFRSYDNQFFTYDIGIDTETIDPSRSNHFLYDEDIQAAYAQFSFKKGIMGLQMGLRGESVNTVSELLDTGEKYENPYTSFFPSGSFSIELPMSLQMQTSYSRRINRPSFRKLNPVAHQFDQNSIRKGNPFLDPEYIDIAELNVSGFSHGMSATLGTYFRRTTDKISYNKTIDSSGVTTVTYENFDEEKTFGIEGVFSGSNHKKLRLMFSGNIYMDKVNASNVFDSDDYDQTSIGFMGRFTATYNITPTMEIMMMGFYRSPRDIPFGNLNSMSFTSLSVKQKFIDDRLAVSLRLNDLFNTMGFGYTTEGEYYYQESYRKFDSQIASISLEYNFGKMEDRSRYSRKRNDKRNGSDMGGFEIE
jgi:outer membrane receptor protein involved in Fe transport